MAHTLQEVTDIFEVLVQECSMGLAHMRIGANLSYRLKRLSPERDPSPVFFYMSLEGHDHDAILRLIKLFDTHPDAVTIDLLLRIVERDAHLFRHASQREVLSAAAEDRATLTEVAPVLATLMNRRNAHLAHLSKELTAGGIREIERRYPVEYGEIARLYEIATAILSRHFQFLSGRLLAFEPAVGEEDVYDLFDLLDRQANGGGGNA